MNTRELTREDLLGPLNETERKHAPKVLYAAGDISFLQSAARVSIVGSRKASEDGLKRARHLSRILAERGVVVVSGLAEGIDTAAHTAAIRAGGRTVGVLGTPLDKSYPRSSRDLQAQMARELLVLSQFPLGVATHKGCFPMRNRTMALISDATVIIEAGESSGSLSQGWEALRLGRPLFIAKSVVENPDLTWPAEMVGYGASVLAKDDLDAPFDELPDRSLVLSCHAPPF